MRAQKMDSPNQGIKCMVDTCDYYMSGDHCCAQKIEVQPKHASNSEDTDCATFIPKRSATW